LSLSSGRFAAIRMTHESRSSGRFAAISMTRLSPSSGRLAPIRVARARHQRFAKISVLGVNFAVVSTL